MSERLAVTKTHKLWVGGKFPRSESGRTLEVCDRKGNPLGLVAHASRKDLRDAVTAAADAGGATAYGNARAAYSHAGVSDSDPHAAADAHTCAVDSDPHPGADAHTGAAD